MQKGFFFKCITLTLYASGEPLSAEEIWLQIADSFGKDLRYLNGKTKKLSMESCLSRLTKHGYVVRLPKLAGEKRSVYTLASMQDVVVASTLHRMAMLE